MGNRDEVLSTLQKDITSRVKTSTPVCIHDMSGAEKGDFQNFAKNNATEITTTRYFLNNNGDKELLLKTNDNNDSPFSMGNEFLFEKQLSQLVNN